MHTRPKEMLLEETKNHCVLYSKTWVEWIFKIAKNYVCFIYKQQFMMLYKNIETQLG
jgi:hypothetical protein